jgi:DNA modification methylase
MSDTLNVESAPAVAVQRLVRRIWCGDNTEVLSGFPDACIDLVVTSPPYDDLRTYLFANAVVWRDTVTDEEKQSIIAELKAAGVKPRKTS